MAVDYRSLFVRVQRGVPNHLTLTHTLRPPRLSITGTTHHRISVYGHQAAATPPQHIAHETKMLAKAPERL